MKVPGGGNSGGCVQMQDSGKAEERDWVGNLLEKGSDQS